MVPVSLSNMSLAAPTPVGPLRTAKRTVSPGSRVGWAVVSTGALVSGVAVSGTGLVSAVF